MANELTPAQLLDMHVAMSDRYNEAARKAGRDRIEHQRRVALFGRKRP